MNGLSNKQTDYERIGYKAVVQTGGDSKEEQKGADHMTRPPEVLPQHRRETLPERPPAAALSLDRPGALAPQITDTVRRLLASGSNAFPLALREPQLPVSSPHTSGLVEPEPYGAMLLRELRIPLSPDQSRYLITRYISEDLLPYLENLLYPFDPVVVPGELSSPTAYQWPDPYEPMKRWVARPLEFSRVMPGYAHIALHAVRQSQVPFGRFWVLDSYIEYSHVDPYLAGQIGDQLVTIAWWS